jgi:hypothetical protein
LGKEEFTINLKGVGENKQDSWDLFIKHFGPIDRDEMIEFAQTLPEQSKFTAPYIDEKGKPIQKLKYRVNRLGEHHFFDLLGRNPQAIILTALLRKSN